METRYTHFRATNEDENSYFSVSFLTPFFLLQGGRYKSWKRRWFILNDNCLYYFEYTTDKEPRGIIPLENIQVRIRMNVLPFFFKSIFIVSVNHHYYDTLIT